MRIRTLVFATLLLIFAGGCRPKCENCQPKSATLFECHHWANDPNGAPCSTTTCIHNTLDSASCESFPDRSGDPKCDTDTARGGEVVQRIITADCPGGTVAWATWQTLYFGCGTNCTANVYQKACETERCQGPLLRGPFDRGVKKKCGC